MNRYRGTQRGQRTAGVPGVEAGLEDRGVRVCEKRSTGEVKAEGSASTMRVFAAPFGVVSRFRILYITLVAVPAFARVERGAQLSPSGISAA